MTQAEPEEVEGRPSWGWRALGLFWIVLTAGADFGVVRGVVLQAPTGSWTPVGAVVVSNTIRVQRSGDGSEVVGRVEYRYSVGGRDYTSTLITRGSTTTSRDVEQLQGRAAGAAIGAFVNPGDPGEAVLRAGWQLEDGVKAILVVPFNLISAMLIGILFVPSRRRNERLAGLLFGAFGALPGGVLGGFANTDIGVLAGAVVMFVGVGVGCVFGVRRARGAASAGREGRA